MDTPAQTPTEQQIIALFEEWQSALRTGDVNQVADRYAPDAVLLPTLSPRIRTTREEIVDYFVGFLAKQPEAWVTERVIAVLAPDCAVDSGRYSFALTQNGTRQQVEARYTFVYRRTGEAWLIVSHHSSLLPDE
jgi:uncharacterized protein (TIGR02246 family)